MELQEVPENDHTIRMGYFYDKGENKLLMIQTSKEVRVYDGENRLEVEK